MRGRHGSDGRGAAAEVVCCCSALVGAVALWRLSSGAGSALGSVLGAAAVGEIVCAVLLSRWRRPVLAVVAGTVCMAVVSVESAVPAAWHHELLDAATWRSVAHALHASPVSWALLSGGRASRPGVVLAASLLAGLAGVYGRLLLGSSPGRGVTSYPAASTVPSLGLVLWSVAALPGAGAVLLAAGAAAVAGATVLVTMPPGAGALRPSAPGGPGTPVVGVGPARRISPALVVMGSALAVLVVLAGSLAATGAGGGSGSAPSAGSGSAGAPPTAEALTTDVTGFAARDPQVVLFRARTTAPTYWQVAVLTTRVGDGWVASPALERALRAGTRRSGDDAQPPAATGAPANAASSSATGISANAASRVATNASPNAASSAGGTDGSLPAPSPAAGAGPAGGTLDASVTIASFASRALPVPVGTVSVHSAVPVRTTDQAVVRSAPTAPGDRYSATAVVPDVAASDGGGTNAPSSLTSAGRQVDLSLPRVPAVIRRLAHQAGAGGASAPVITQRLVDWFRSGRFRYTTTPTRVPRGVDPVVSFLTKTRTGDCQTFADAFTVMARVLGLPTRVAVGFTAGSRSPGGVTTVRGADAHAWPEVYLGATLGWVSVEPTPSQPSGSGTPVDVLEPGGIGKTTPSPAPSPAPAPGPAPSTGPGGTSPPSGTTPTPGSVAPGHVSPAPSPAGSPGRSPAPSPAGGTGWPWLVVLVVVAGAAAVALAVGALVAVVGGRRRRLALRRTDASAVLGAWERCDRRLASLGLGCPRSRPHGVHARVLLHGAGRLGGGVGPGGDRVDRGVVALRSVLVDLVCLAVVEEQVRYGRDPVLPGQVREALGAADRLRGALGRRSVRRAARRLAVELAGGRGGGAGAGAGNPGDRGGEDEGTEPGSRASTQCGEGHQGGVARRDQRLPV